MLKGEMNMENIKFYTNQEEDFLLAYEKDTSIGSKKSSIFLLAYDFLLPML